MQLFNGTDEQSCMSPLDMYLLVCRGEWDHMSDADKQPWEEFVVHYNRLKARNPDMETDYLRNLLLAYMKEYRKYELVSHYAYAASEEQMPAHTRTRFSKHR